jgi:hypothetical protein
MVTIEKGIWDDVYKNEGLLELPGGGGGERNGNETEREREREKSKHNTQKFAMPTNKS